MTYGLAGHGRADRAGASPVGAASRKIRPDSRTSPNPASSISATTISEAIASARANPVMHDDDAGDRGGDERVHVGEQVLERALQVEAACGARLARASSIVVATFTATPASATPITAPPATAGGVISRRIAS